MVAREAADLLEDLARRGRSQGIHLVLASQDVRGIEALWGRPALVAQFTLRIALPKALRILAERNDAAQSLPRHHAVINAESGLAEGNEVARIPSARDWETWSELQHRLWRMRPQDAAPARLRQKKTRSRSWRRAGIRALTAPEQGVPRNPVALLGEIIDVQARSAALRLPRAPGRNLAVLGTRVDEACAVLDAAARSLARQYPPGAARFSIACLDPDADPAARALYEDLAGDASWYDEETVPELMAEAGDGLGAPGASRTPHFLLLYAVDAAAGRSPARPVRAPGWSSCAGSCTTGRNGVRTCWPGGGAWPGCGPTWAARARARIRSAPGWRSTCRAVSWAPRCIRAAEGRTGIPGRGAVSTSTGRCTAPDR
ncbi:hypothetical protein MCBG_01073 [Micromonospora sp. M42]|nr:hypothetical protein MCBG_01073 [Micromonospora sp. M42]